MPTAALTGQPRSAPKAEERSTAGADARVHRGDIDGLRAVAVLAVVLAHAGIGGFAGGYVGVDVFFVISGFLIHADLVTRIRQGRFKLLGFYGRRMRRTIPALLLVGFATLAASAVVLLPGDYDAAARSLVGAILLVPNLVFWSQTGYFDADAAVKPLLHTWSLGVEEQFYVVAPILALGLGLLRRRTRLGVAFALAALFISGLIGAIAIRAASPAAAFYLMPARVFEFVIGMALSESVLPAPSSRAVAETLTLMAALALAAAITTFSAATWHPGIATLLPCFATAAIIHVGASHHTSVATLLSRPVPAFIGRISYSLYLWHWPMLVLTRYGQVPQSLPWMGAEGATILGLSVLSWRYVEQPFRDPASRWRARAPWLLPVGALALAGSCAGVVLLDGLPRRFPSDVASVAAYYAYRDTRPFREGQCFITSKNSLADFDRSTCLALDEEKPNVLLLGDSHAAHLWTGLRETWPEVHFLQATASGCKPVLGASGAGRCTALMADMLERFIPDHRLDAVIFAGLWDKADLAPLARTITASIPHVGHVVVFGPMPRYDQPVATLLAKSMLHHDLGAMATHRLPVFVLDAAMRAMVRPPATYVSPYTAMCATGTCRLFVAAGIPMQFDYHHLTAPGSGALMRTIRAEHPRLFDPPP